METVDGGRVLSIAQKGYRPDVLVDDQQIVDCNVLIDIEGHCSSVCVRGCAYVIGCSEFSEIATTSIYAEDDIIIVAPHGTALTLIVDVLYTKGLIYLVGDVQLLPNEESHILIYGTIVVN